MSVLTQTSVRSAQPLYFWAHQNYSSILQLPPCFTGTSHCCELNFLRIKALIKYTMFHITQPNFLHYWQHSFLIGVQYGETVKIVTDQCTLCHTTDQADTNKRMVINWTDGLGKGMSAGLLAADYYPLTFTGKYMDVFGSLNCTTQNQSVRLIFPVSVFETVCLWLPRPMHVDHNPVGPFWKLNTFAHLIVSVIGLFDYKDHLSWGKLFLHKQKIQMKPSILIQGIVPFSNARSELGNQYHVEHDQGQPLYSSVRVGNPWGTEDTANRIFPL